MMDIYGLLSYYAVSLHLNYAAPISKQYLYKLLKYYKHAIN